MSKPSPSGLCAVCGTTATTRCSSCSPHNLDLFFCSREHQKLVWKQHKRDVVDMLTVGGHHSAFTDVEQETLLPFVYLTASLHRGDLRPNPSARTHPFEDILQRWRSTFRLLHSKTGNRQGGATPEVLEKWYGAKRSDQVKLFSVVAQGMENRHTSLSGKERLVALTRAALQNRGGAQRSRLAFHHPFHVVSPFIVALGEILELKYGLTNSPNRSQPDWAVELQHLALVVASFCCSNLNRMQTADPVSASKRMYDLLEETGGIYESVKVAAKSYMAKVLVDLAQAKLGMNKPKVESSFRYVINCDVSFDITSTSVDLKEKLPGLALEGDWTTTIYHDGDEGIIRVGFFLNLKGLPDGHFGQTVETRTELFWVKGDEAGSITSLTTRDPLPWVNLDYGIVYSEYSLEVEPTDWEEAAAKLEGKYDPSTHRDYRLVITLEKDYPDAVYKSVERSVKEKEAKVLASRIADASHHANLEQLPHDVRLYFPRVHEKGAELWVKADFLSKSATYFRDLSASGLAETIPRRSKRARTGGVVKQAAAPPVEKDFEDSDDETDAFLSSKQPPTLADSSAGEDYLYRQISIPQTAFSTYRTALLYLQTGYISFLPLSSSVSPESRTECLDQAFAEDPCLPFPVSPKSLYRLAHLLSLDDLQKLALTAFKDSLSVKNAAKELFSDTSIAHDHLRAAVLEVVKEKWKEIKKSAGWKDALGKIKAGEFKEAAPVLGEVFEAVHGV
ncbi:hypothetical protein JCM8547_000517 [Rhodosporidiobolus lusitaniae]